MSYFISIDTLNNYPLISFLKFDTKSDEAALTDKCNKFNGRFKNCVTIAFVFHFLFKYKLKTKSLL